MYLKLLHSIFNLSSQIIDPGGGTFIGAARLFHLSQIWILETSGRQEVFKMYEKVCMSQLPRSSLVTRSKSNPLVQWELQNRKINASWLLSVWLAIFVFHSIYINLKLTNVHTETAAEQRDIVSLYQSWTHPLSTTLFLIFTPFYFLEFYLFCSFFYILIQEEILLCILLKWLVSFISHYVLSCIFLKKEKKNL